MDFLMAVSLSSSSVAPISINASVCLSPDQLKQELAILAEHEDLLALRRLSLHYKVCKSKPQKAIEYLRRSARVGTPADAVLLADEYETQGNLESAFSTYLQSAERGDVDAMAWVANAYSKGIGVEKNLTLAMKFYELAARGGDYSSMKHLSDAAEQNGNLPLAAAWGSLASKAAPAQFQPKTTWALKAAELFNGLNVRGRELEREFEREFQHEN